MYAMLIPHPDNGAINVLRNVGILSYH